MVNDEIHVKLVVSPDNKARGINTCTAKQNGVGELSEPLNELLIRRQSSPKPCKFDSTTKQWFAKILEEVTEAHTEAVAYDVLNMRKHELVVELTDVITVCTSYLESLGIDEYKRMEIQREVNRKNAVRGYLK